LTDRNRKVQRHRCRQTQRQRETTQRVLQIERRKNEKLVGGRIEFRKCQNQSTRDKKFGNKILYHVDIKKVKDKEG